MARRRSAKPSTKAPSPSAGATKASTTDSADAASAESSAPAASGNGTHEPTPQPPSAGSDPSAQPPSTDPDTSAQPVGDRPADAPTKASTERAPAGELVPDVPAPADQPASDAPPPADADAVVVTTVVDDEEVPSPVSPARFGESGRTEAGSRSPGMSRQRAIRAALASLPPPSPGPSFWADLDAALADQESFAITARPAIRPISEPPPLSQPRLGDRDPGGTWSPGSATPRPELAASDLVLDDPGKGRRNVVVVVAVAIIAGLLVLSSALGQDDDEVPATSTTSTSRAPDEATTSTTGLTTTAAPQVPGLDPAARLTSGGLGPFRIGLRGRDLEDEGVEMVVDETTFQGSGGRCFDVYVPGAPDLVLRFRSGDPEQGVDDPVDGVLAAVSVMATQGSTRVTDAEVGLGATAEQVQSAHAGDLEVSPHPMGQVYVVEAPDGSGNGVAYVVDGSQVAEINVGALDVIPQPQTCA